jgi:protein TonB
VVTPLAIAAHASASGPRTEGRGPAGLRRRRHRRGAVAWAAVVASLSAHALFAALIGVSLRAAGSRERPPSSGVEVEIAEVPAPAIAEPPALEPSQPVVSRRVPVRPTTARARSADPEVAAAPERPQPLVPAPARRELVAPAPESVAPAVALFAMSAGTVAGTGASSLPPRVNAAADGAPLTAGLGVGDGAGDQPFAADAIDVPARLVSSRPAVYPAVARNAEVETDVALEIVVGTDGVVSDAGVVAPRGYGLDAAALQAVRGYRFSPARRASRAVPVRMRWIVQFRLR